MDGFYKETSVMKICSVREEYFMIKTEIKGGKYYDFKFSKDCRIELAVMYGCESCRNK